MANVYEIVNEWENEYSYHDWYRVEWINGFTNELHQGIITDHEHAEKYVNEAHWNQQDNACANFYRYCIVSNEEALAYFKERCAALDARANEE